MRGTVLRGTGGVWHVLSQRGETLEAVLRGRLKQTGEDVRKLAVGDEVELERTGGDSSADGAWAIVEILPRRSQLARREPGGRHGARVVVANVDQVLVVFAAAKPDPHRRMLDRFLVIAEGNAVAARIVINKSDLAGEGVVRERFADYTRAGYPVHCTSVKTGTGLAELGVVLRGRSTALSGPSGVGKSSLLNALYPGLALRVGAISESVNKGRHTTVGALLHPLPDGGFVVDTPGLREVGVWGLAAERLDRCFPEFRSLVEACRFADCAHTAEPECAVRHAVAAGTVSAERYGSYVTLRTELL